MGLMKALSTTSEKDNDLFLVICAWLPNGYQVQNTQGIVDKIL